MERDSSADGLLFLGIILFILGGFSVGSDIEPVWVGTLRFYFFIAGVTLIIAAVVIKLRERKNHLRVERAGFFAT